MIFEQGSLAALVLLAGCALFLLITQNWRRAMIALSIQYLSAFWLVGLSWTLGLAVIKLVVGWMVVATLGASHIRDDLVDERYRGLTGRVFRFLAAGLVMIVVFSVAPGIFQLIGLKFVILWGGLLLVGLGVLQLGMTTMPLRVIIGLLTILSGFEIMYAAVEKSLLVTGLLAAVNMGLALVGAYLLSGLTVNEAE